MFRLERPLSCNFRFAFLARWSLSIKWRIWSHRKTQDDTQDFVRRWSCINPCLLHESCSKLAFKRAQCYSFISDEKCLQYCLQHLMHSCLHNPPVNDARRVLSNPRRLNWLAGEDTFADREWYRAAAAHAQVDADPSPLYAGNAFL